MNYHWRNKRKSNWNNAYPCFMLIIIVYNVIILLIPLLYDSFLFLFCILLLFYCIEFWDFSSELQFFHKMFSNHLSQRQRTPANKDNKLIKILENWINGMSWFCSIYISILARELFIETIENNRFSIFWIFQVI